MPGFILHAGAPTFCLHGGQAVGIPYPRVTVSGQPVMTLASQYTIGGCALSASGTPCATGKWVVGAMRATAGGMPLAIFPGTAVCVPTGTGLLPIGFQVRASAT